MPPLNPEQFSAYDERPDPRGPGQQGVLFRRVAPAMSEQTRYHHPPVEHSYDAEVDRFTAQGAVHNIPTELYHGTAAKLKPGSLIRPGQHPNFGTRGANFGHGISADVNREHVFATGNLADAYRYARIAQQSGNWNTDYARPHVYRVQPTGPVQADAEDADYRAGYSDTPDLEAYQSKQPYRVLSRVQFPEAKEAYRSYMEDELGSEPGKYEFADKTPEQRHEERYGW